MTPIHISTLKSVSQALKKLNYFIINANPEAHAKGLCLREKYMILIIEMQSEKTCFAFLEKQQRLWLKGERIMPEEKEKERKVIKVTLNELNNVSGGDTYA